VIIRFIKGQPQEAEKNLAMLTGTIGSGIASNTSLRTIASFDPALLTVT
jgi:hypothetical protein